MDWTEKNHVLGCGFVWALLLACALLAVDVSAATTNHAPLVGNAPLTSVKAGNNYGYTPLVWDQDNDVLRYSITHAPSWATFSTTTGKLSGTPSNANAGTTTGIVITVSDGKTATAIGPFSITVVYVNHPPMVAYTPLTWVNAGSSYSYTPLAWDVDHDVLKFSITHAPSWATFSTSTGRLSGTPTAANVGTTTGVVITVSDGKSTVSIGPFSITVASVNHPPTVVYTPVTSVTAGSSYSYTPLAWDVDHDVLKFSITHAPSWAAFSTSTGRLSGTPTIANVGTTTGVVITVSDGKSSAAIGPFNITVVKASSGTASGTATLHWVAPTTRQDGTSFSLSQLRGYRVYKGTAATSLALAVNVASATATSYTFSNLAPGTYYFAVTAYDVAGVQSRYSSIVSKVIK